MPIVQYEDFFPEEIFQECVATAKDLLQRPTNVFCTNRFWDFDIRKDSFPVLIHNIFKNTDLHNNVKKIIEQKTERDINDSNIMMYFWTRHSYIPWHNDYTYDGAITIYMNNEWHRDFGGYFIYEDDNQDLKAIIPKRNLGVMQYGSVQHCTTPVNYDGDLRITVQAFLRNRTK